MYDGDDAVAEDQRAARGTAHTHLLHPIDIELISNEVCCAQSSEPRPGTRPTAGARRPAEEEEEESWVPRSDPSHAPSSFPVSVRSYRPLPTASYDPLCRVGRSDAPAVSISEHPETTGPCIITALTGPIETKPD
jgi:hypothetical protein